MLTLKKSLGSLGGGNHFIEIDKDAYEVRDSKGYNGLWAYSKDTYNWTLLKGKRSINKTITGSPIEIARYIADWYDKEAK